MGWANKIIGWTTGNGAEVDTNNQLKVALSNTPAQMGGVRAFFENDPGLATGNVYLQSPEVDDDYRIRVSQDLMLDEESITYTAQNFTKHFMGATTFVPTWTATGFNTNPSNLTTAAAATVFKTYKTFSIQGTETLSLDVEASISWASGATVPANTIFELGFGLTANTAPYDFFDGVYLRFNNSGAYGVIRNNSATDSSITSAFKGVDGLAWNPINGRKYQFIIYSTPRICEFWIHDPVLDQVWLANELIVPAGFGLPTASQSQAVVFRQYLPSAASVASSLQLSHYSVRRGGSNLATSLNELSARAYDSILSPGTLTTTANQTVTTGTIVPAAAAAPTNTAALLTSLSGIVLELGTLATATDGILMAYQNPALPTATGTTFAQNRRLRINGVSISSCVQTAFATGGYVAQFYLAYGSTSVSLQGVAADTVTTKAARRVQLPIAQAFTATQAAGTLPTGDYSKQVTFSTPIYVNPGEFVALVTRHTGTAGTSGVVQHAIAFDYSWE